MQKEFSQVSKGNAKAFKKVFDHYFEMLVEYSCSFTTNSEASKDIVQEVFMMVWDKSKRIRPETFHTYLYKATYNQTLNYLRQHKKAVPLEMLNESILKNDPDNRDDLLETKKLLLIQTIEHLSRKCREIFKKNKIEGLSYRQTAQELGLSEKTVERQVGIAFKKIRTYFAIKN